MDEHVGTKTGQRKHAAAYYHSGITVVTRQATERETERAAEREREEERKGETGKRENE